MFQNTFQNGNFFELYDPKSSPALTQFPRTRSRTSTSSPMFMAITKSSISNLKVNAL